MRKQLSYANVMSTLAVVIAVAGGTTAIAASLGKNSVTTKSIKSGNVTAPDLAKITRVEAADASGGVVTATCPGKSVLLGGGGGPATDGPSRTDPKSWVSGGTLGQPSTATALCLSTKTGK